MGRVEDEVFVDLFEASGPVNVREGVLDDVEGKVVAGRHNRLAGQGGVVLLMFAGKRNGVTEKRLGHEAERSPGLIGDLSDRFLGFGMLGGREDGFALDGDGRFFARNGIEGVAEPFGVVEGDGSENADIGGNRGGGIESSSHPGFEDDEVAIAVAEMAHCEGEGEFEEGGVMIPISNEVAEFGEESGRFFFGDFQAIDADPFAVVDEVGGGEESGTEGEALGESIDHRAGRTLAVGPGHMNDLGAMRGKGEELAQQAGGPFEPQFDPEGLG